MVLEIQFRCVRKLHVCCLDMYTNVEQNKPVLVVVFKTKAVCNSFKSQYNVLNVSFTCNFSFNTTKVFFNTITSLLRLFIKNG